MLERPSQLCNKTHKFRYPFVNHYEEHRRCGFAEPHRRLQRRTALPIVNPVQKIPIVYPIYSSSIRCTHRIELLPGSHLYKNTPKRKIGPPNFTKNQPSSKGGIICTGVTRGKTENETRSALKTGVWLKEHSDYIKSDYIAFAIESPQRRKLPCPNTLSLKHPRVVDP